jgi:hypothetical protein
MIRLLSDADPARIITQLMVAMPPPITTIAMGAIIAGVVCLLPLTMLTPHDLAQ